MPHPPTAAPKGFDVAGLALIIAAAVLLGLFIRFHVRDNLLPRNFGVVEPGVLYRSGRQTPAMMARLVHQHNIKTIIDLGNAAPGSAEARDWDHLAQALGVRRVNFALNGDGTGDPNDYVAALRIIDDPANQPVLVHCAAGAQRTSACVAFRRSVKDGWTLSAALDESLEYRHRPDRNPNLRPYVEHWQPLIAEALRTGAAIPYTPEQAPAIVARPND